MPASRLLDTGDFYGMGHSELLIRKALRDRSRESVFIQVKFGAQRDPRGAFIGHDARPAAVKTALAYTLTRLGTQTSLSRRLWVRSPNSYERAM
jgi:aryl-alcohol dehydrogenase-like predicted oxidoreductase